MDNSKVLQVLTSMLMASLKTDRDDPYTKQREEEEVALSLAIQTIEELDAFNTSPVACGCGGKTRSYKGECGYGIYCSDCGFTSCGEPSHEDATAAWNRAKGHIPRTNGTWWKM